MATTQLADVYEPLTFNAFVDESAIELNLFLVSGIVSNDPQIATQISAGGRIGELSYYGPLDVSMEPNYSTDNPDSPSVPGKISDKKDIFRLSAMNRSWSAMTLSRELALKDPLGAITDKVGGWWATMEERRVIESSLGILADNVANDSGDMQHDVSIADGDNAGTENLISPNAVLDTKQTMGDHAEALRAIAMHSVVFTNLQKQNVIDYIVNSESNIRIPTYLGYHVVVADSMPVIAGGTSGFIFTTILFAYDSIGSASGHVMVPSEVEHRPSAGDGGGQDVLHTRRSRVFHPYGFQFTSASVAGVSPTLAELGHAANWDRSVARKIVGMAFLKTNG